MGIAIEVSELTKTDGDPSTGSERVLLEEAMRVSRQRRKGDA
jgi:hypothetical protein